MSASKGGREGEPGFWNVFVRFEDALRIGGQHISAQPMDFGPERFHITGELSAEQRRALIAASVDLKEL